MSKPNPLPKRADRLSCEELASRWEMTTGALANWRVEGKGPRFLKIGKFVQYPIVEIEAFEKRMLKRSTSA